jgi:hypothetical protein
MNKLIKAKLEMNMHNFVMYCKTYSGDFDRVSNLVDSFNKYNRDDIYLYISAPKKELYLFQPLSNLHIIVITDESFAKEYLAMEGHSGMTLGYVNQQICKLTFYKTAVTRNYLCLDSDTVFIRDFYISDFMYDEDTPYTVLVMDKELSIEKHYRSLFWVGRQSSIKKIYDFMELNDRRLRTCHNSQVFNVKILESLARDFMKPKALKYNDLLKISPYEFTWYNVWFQKTQLVNEVAVEPFFKMLHMRQDYTFSRLKLLKQEDYAEAFVGLILNSKWTPKTPLSYEDPNSSLYIFFYKIVTGDNVLIKLYSKLARRDVLFVIYRKIFGK